MVPALILKRKKKSNKQTSHKLRECYTAMLEFKFEITVNAAYKNNAIP